MRSGTPESAKSRRKHLRTSRGSLLWYHLRGARQLTQRLRRRMLGSQRDLSITCTYQWNPGTDQTKNVFVFARHRYKLAHDFEPCMGRRLVSDQLRVQAFHPVSLRFKGLADEIRSDMYNPNLRSSLQ